MSPNIHDIARQIRAQSPRPLPAGEEYRILARRRRKHHHGAIMVSQGAADHLQTIETPQGKDAWHRKARLPYADND